MVACLLQEAALPRQQDLFLRPRMGFAEGRPEADSYERLRDSYSGDFLPRKGFFGFLRRNSERIFGILKIIIENDRFCLGQCV